MIKIINKICPQILSFFVLPYLLFMATSCTNTKQLIVLNDLPDSPRILLPQLQSPVITVCPDDILEIKISGMNQTTVTDFNSKGGGFGLGAFTSPSYLVDRNGFIEIYKLGKVKAAGLTVDEIKTNLTNQLQSDLKDATVSVRFINFRFSVLGEVKQPGSFTLLNEKVTILEALAYAGDMTQYAKRSRVRVIRDSSGNREIGILNFNQKTLFTSPYYYLRRNDVVLIESDIQTKKSSENLAKASSIVGILTSIITLIFIIVNRN